LRFNDAVELYVSDQWSQGRFRSPTTEVSYRAALNRLGDVVGNRDPFTINRNDIKRTLSHWKHPNTQRTNRAILTSFFRWAVEEGYRPHNPAEQTRRPRRVPVAV
jgi:site-specific recombinase XerD